MSGKSVGYWQKKYDDVKKELAVSKPHYSDSKANAWTALELLAIYSGFFRSMPIVGLPVAWGGSAARFFKGMWNHHHGNDVQRAIKNYFHMDGEMAISSEYHHVEVVLARVKEQVSVKGEEIKQDGDLDNILEVIQAKTGVSYWDPSIDNSAELVSQYEQSGLA